MSKSPSLRRIQADIRELALEPSPNYTAAPLENDMFEWHFTIRGPPDSDFEGGTYHGRILLPPDYPFKPPHIIFLTKTGRFEINTKICLSFSAFHPELWQPAWGIRLILEALVSFLPTPADGALGSLAWSSNERKTLAKASHDYYCPVCQAFCKDLLPKVEETAKPAAKSSRFQKEIAELQRMQQLEHAKKEGDDDDDNEANEDGGVEEMKDEAAETKETIQEEVKIDERFNAEAPTNAATTNDAPAQVDTTALLQEHVPLVAPHDPPVHTWFGPVLHFCIILLSILSILLLRKIQALVADIRALQQE